MRTTHVECCASSRGWQGRNRLQNLRTHPGTRAFGMHRAQHKAASLKVPARSAKSEQCRSHAHRTLSLPTQHTTATTTDNNRNFQMACSPTAAQLPQSSSRVQHPAFPSVSRGPLSYIPFVSSTMLMHAPASTRSSVSALISLHWLSCDSPRAWQAIATNALP